MTQYGTFIRKEFLHIFRDRRTMLILLAMPVVQIIIFGFAISTEVRNVRLAVLDPVKSIHTARIVEQLDQSEYFTLTENCSDPSQIDLLMRRNVVDMAIVFDENFDTDHKIQIVTDGSDSNTASVATSYVSAIIAGGQMDFSPLRTSTKLLYNPSMKSAYNFVPGVMGLILMLICAMMTSISIVREKERGTMEVLLVSPLDPIVMIMAKLVPYFVLSCVNLATILLLSVFVLSVPISGSLGWLIALSLLFIFVALSLGLFISTMVKSQVAAMIISGMVLMMPTIILSGMMFPIENMPVVLQGVSTLIPARWYIEGVRKLMIQGVEIQFVIKEFVILTGMALVLVAVSLKKFKIRL